MWSDTAVLPFICSLALSISGLEKISIYWIQKIIASTDTIYKQEITNSEEKFIKNGYSKKFVDDIVERSINKNKECINEKLYNSSFKNFLKVPNIGKPSSEYKKKLEKLSNNYVKDFKVIFTTSKVGNYFSNKEQPISRIET